MKSALILATLALAGGAVFAQAPAGVVPRPSQEQNPNASGGAAQAKGAMNNDAKTSKPMAGAMTTATMGNSAMDTNGDGFISRKEWNAYHGRMWSGMKANKRGMVPWADVEAKMKGGPN